MSDSIAAVPVTRDTIIREFSDGDLGVRLVVAAVDVEAFWEAFPEMAQHGFLACDDGAVECVRDAIQGEYRDGSLGVRIKIAAKDKAAFRRLWPHPKMPAVLAREDQRRGREAMQDAMADGEARFGAQARALRIHMAFLFNPKVWAAVGEDGDYLAWLRTQPCAHCKWQPRWEMDCYVQCEAAHVRRIQDGAGTAIKPKYSAIPLCPTRPGVEGCHAAQHRQGESFLGGEEAVDKLRVKYVTAWVWAALKEELGYAHWNEVSPEVLRAWAAENSLLETLPPCYLTE